MGQQGFGNFQSCSIPMDKTPMTVSPILQRKDAELVEHIYYFLKARTLTEWAGAGDRWTRGAQAGGYDTMVTFLLLFTNKKSFQSISFSLSGKQGGGCGVAPGPATGAGGWCPHLLHDGLDLVL